MPLTNAHDYEPCPACGGRRWKGLVVPVCNPCEFNVLDRRWLLLRRQLAADNASVAVLALFDKAMVADCKEILESQRTPRPYRRRHVTKA